MNSFSVRKHITIDPQEIDLNFCSSHLPKPIAKKFAFKTKEDSWVSKELPVIVPISIHSNFHKGADGMIKMSAFISTIMDHVKAKTTFLLTETAHLQVYRLRCEDSIETAFDDCLRDANHLVTRFQKIFEGCHFAFSHSYINEDQHIKSARDTIQDLYKNDATFRDLLKKDAENYYARENVDEFPSKELYLERAILDILEQCAYVLVFSKKGYRFQLYPGASNSSMDYINEIILEPEERVCFIKVSLSLYR